MNASVDINPDHVVEYSAEEVVQILGQLAAQRLGLSGSFRIKLQLDVDDGVLTRATVSIWNNQEDA